jgi:superfamily II DNA or RNA helicase
MSFTLRPYQQQVKDQVYDAWNKGHKKTLLVVPTGGGKTVVFCSIVLDAINGDINGEKMPTAVFVHREELVGQISQTLAKVGVSHNLIAPPGVIAQITKGHRREFGRAFYNSQSSVTVISLDTFNSRFEKSYRKWTTKIRLWVVDEAAHVLEENKWGKALSKLEVDCLGLGVTATPHRLDRKGLGTKVRGGCGVFDKMIQGVSTFWLIKNNFLSDFKIASPTSNFVEHLAAAKEDKDYTLSQMQDATVKSNIIGDVVENYFKFASGKQAIVFATGLVSAEELERKFIAKGVPALFLCGTSLKTNRADGIEKFRQGKIKILINVDLFDEGFDVPAVEVVIMARPTTSLGKYLQMIGRGLRIANGKTHAIIIDHVENVKRHGPPHIIRTWSLKSSPKRAIKNTRDCWNVPKCGLPFDKTLTFCPYCGVDAIDPNKVNPKINRIPPAQVDGDLDLLDSETLAKLYKIAEPVDPIKQQNKVGSLYGLAAGIKAKNDAIAKNETSKWLAETIAQWAGQHKHDGRNDREIHKIFYAEHGLTIPEALGQPKTDMESLIKKLTIVLS